MRSCLLDVQLSDAARAMELHSDGAYRKVQHGDGDAAPTDAQLARTFSDLTFMQ